MLKNQNFSPFSFLRGKYGKSKKRNGIKEEDKK